MRYFRRSPAPSAAFLLRATAPAPTTRWASGFGTDAHPRRARDLLGRPGSTRGTRVCDRVAASTRGARISGHTATTGGTRVTRRTAAAARTAAAGVVKIAPAPTTAIGGAAGAMVMAMVVVVVVAGVTVVVVPVLVTRVVVSPGRAVITAPTVVGRTVVVTGAQHARGQDRGDRKKEGEESRFHLFFETEKGADDKLPFEYPCPTLTGRAAFR